jgi:hypothetical protein
VPNSPAVRSQGMLDNLGPWAGHWPFRLVLALGYAWLPAWGRAASRLEPSGPPGELGLLPEEDYPRGTSHQSLAVRASPYSGRQESPRRHCLPQQACGLLRQLVCLTGWLVLLAATARPLVQPCLDLGHLVAPGTGALAVFQAAPAENLIRPGGSRCTECTVSGAGACVGPLGRLVTVPA